MKRALVAVLLGAAVVAAGCGSSHVRTARHSAPRAAHSRIFARSLRLQKASSSTSCVGRCVWARQEALDHAANDAMRIAGAVHVFSGVRVDVPADTVVVHLTHAPDSVIDRLRATHPGIYVIDNGAPRTWREVRALQDALDWTAWTKKGVHIVSTGPTQNGYLEVGVTSNIANAQALFDEAYGPGVIRVVHGEPIMAFCACGPAR